MLVFSSKFSFSFGEDSDYTINPPSYTDNGDGTVTDNVTGLIWQQEDDNTQRSREDANTYCISIGMRLPTAKELMQIVHNDSSDPAIDTNTFINTHSSAYWSSSTYALDCCVAGWYVDFSDGYVDNYYKPYNGYVRCVNGSESDPSLKDNSDSTVTDNVTGLMWQQQEGGNMDWEAALAYCEGLSLAGYSDWRLPNKNDLQSIVDYSRINPALNTLFFTVSASHYWSSTTYAASSNRAWSMYSGHGSLYYYNKLESFDVRCVRTGS